MLNALRAATTDRGIKRMLVGAVVTSIVLMAFLSFGVVRTWSVADDLKQDRVAACHRGNVFRGEVAQLSATLRHVVLLAVQNARPRSERTVDQELAYRAFKQEANRLKVAIERLHPVTCEEE